MRLVPQFLACLKWWHQVSQLRLLLPPLENGHHWLHLYPRPCLIPALSALRLLLALKYLREASCHQPAIIRLSQLSMYNHLHQACKHHLPLVQVKMVLQALLLVTFFEELYRVQFKRTTYHHLLLIVNLLHLLLFHLSPRQESVERKGMLVLRPRLG